MHAYNVQAGTCPRLCSTRSSSVRRRRGSASNGCCAHVLVAEASVSTNSAVLADAANDAEGVAAKAGDAAAELPASVRP